uniref:Uncharacterized protein n=1 Tax=Octopus bimaculoides TaxID=37653 RepID=A0A0L8FJ60_OCTBM
MSASKGLPDTGQYSESSFHSHRGIRCCVRVCRGKICHSLTVARGNYVIICEIRQLTKIFRSGNTSPRGDISFCLFLSEVSSDTSDLSSSEFTLLTFFIDRIIPFNLSVKSAFLPVTYCPYNLKYFFNSGTVSTSIAESSSCFISMIRRKTITMAWVASRSLIIYMERRLAKGDNLLINDRLLSVSYLFIAHKGLHTEGTNRLSRLY